MKRPSRDTLIKAAIVASGLAVVGVFIGFKVASIPSGPDYNNVIPYIQARALAHRANPTPGYIYRLEPGCHATFSETSVADVPMYPVGQPIRGWKPITASPYYRGGCPKTVPMAGASTMGPWVQETGPGERIGADGWFSLGIGPWVFTTLGPTEAVAAHLIPSLPLVTTQYPRGFPGYVYELNSQCTATEYVLPVSGRPYAPQYVQDPTGNVNEILHLEVGDGTYHNGRCPMLDPESPGIYLDIPQGQLRWFGQWVYTQLGPNAAYEAHLIPTLPKLAKG